MISFDTKYFISIKCQSNIKKGVKFALHGLVKVPIGILTQNLEFSFFFFYFILIFGILKMCFGHNGFFFGTKDDFQIVSNYLYIFTKIITN